MVMMSSEDPSSASADRVRRSSSVEQNTAIDRETDANIHFYRRQAPDEILQRVRVLDKEWDIERVLEVNASTLMLTGLMLGIARNRKWLALPLVVSSFLLLHGVRGWCPPLPLLRRLGVRTRGEIDREKYALLDELSRR